MYGRISNLSLIWSVKKWQNLAQISKCRTDELGEMEQDMVENRSQFAEKCHDFVFKRKAKQTPKRLVASWALASSSNWASVMKEKFIVEETA